MCQSDVCILKQACLTFEHEFRDTCGFDPFEECITIASSCNTTLCRNWMRKATIAVKPLRRWNLQIRQSSATFEWLYHLEQILPPPQDSEPHIRHSKNGERCCFTSARAGITPTAMIPGQALCTNFKGVPSKAVPNATPNDTNGMPSWIR